MFPKLLVDGITLIYFILQNEPNYDKLSEHKSYTKLLDSVHLNKQAYFDTFLSLFTTEIPLLKLLNQILNNINDFKCIHESVKYRRIEYEIYHFNFLETENNSISGHSSDEVNYYESYGVYKFVLNIILSFFINS